MKNLLRNFLLILFFTTIRPGSSQDSAAGKWATNERPLTPDISFELWRPVEWVGERGGRTLPWDPGPSTYVNRLGNTNREASVDYTLGGGTAVPGLDYTPTMGTLHFAPMEVTQRVALPILNDSLVDGNKTFQIKLVNPSAGAVLGPQNSAEVLIYDDDVGIEFDPAYVTVGENAGTATLLVRRFTGELTPIQLNYATADGTAIAGHDYVASSGVISFATDEIEQKLVIPILDDELSEPIKDFTVTLTDPLNRLVLGAQSVATIQIFDDDGRVRFDKSFVPAPSASGFFAMQPDGRIFSATSNSVVRLNLDGSIDAGFIPIKTTNSDEYQRVYALAVQPDGKVVVGGGFEEINGVPRHGLARLETDGTVDLNFNISPSFIDSFVGNISDLAVQPDGRILVGGSFSITADTGDVRFLALIRLFADGRLDTGFDARSTLLPYSGWRNGIASLLPQPDGKILFVSGVYPGSRAPFFDLLRLNDDGSLDSGFNPPQASDGILPVGLQADGNLIAYETFGNKAYSARHLVRLGSDGSADEKFTRTLETQGIGAYSRVAAAAVQPDGKLLVLGEMPSADGAYRFGLFRLMQNGVRDPDYELEMPPNWGVTEIIALSNGSAVLAGGFQFEYDRPYGGFARVQIGTSTLEFKSITRLPDGQVRLSLATEHGKTYEIQASVDLVNWAVWGAVNGTGDTMEFEDVDAPNKPRRFYRVVATSGTVNGDN